jgi:hypothetical protein
MALGMDRPGPNRVVEDLGKSAKARSNEASDGLPLSKGFLLGL